VAPRVPCVPYPTGTGRDYTLDSLPSTPTWQPYTLNHIPVSYILCQLPYILNPNTLYPLSCILYPISYILYPISFILYPIPYTLYSIPYDLYPVTYLPYPIPYTLYLIPYTLLHPMPYTLKRFVRYRT
jgi:hypothetical protein